jgi:hypothetical protein
MPMNPYMETTGTSENPAEIVLHMEMTIKEEM